MNVAPTSPGSYGENAFKSAAQAYAHLQDHGHIGPYAIALHSDIYADTLAPVANMPSSPAEQLRQLAPLGLVGTGALMPKSGVVVSLGGNSVDLVVGMEPTTEVLSQDDDGFQQFRVFERFVLRVKDKTAIVRLTFQ